MYRRRDMRTLPFSFETLLRARREDLRRYAAWLGVSPAPYANEYEAHYRLAQHVARVLKKGRHCRNHAAMARSMDGGRE